MRVFELKFPGNRPVLESAEESLEAMRTLDAMASYLSSAAVTLHLFDQAYADVVGGIEKAWSDWERRDAERAAALAELLAEMELERATPLTFGERALASIALGDEAARRAYQKRLAAGAWPEQYRRQLPFAHSAAFVHVLNVFSLLLAQLAERWGRIRPGLMGIAQTFDRAIPDLKGVRDSLAHLNERLRKQAKIVGKTYQIEADRWEISNLWDREFGILIVDGTRDDATGKVPGRVGSIPITADTVEAVRIALQSALDAFDWEGPQRYAPG
jgi:hypothetical protein